MKPLRIAVDGWNLAADRRGMGRYARAVLETLATESDIDLTVVVKSTDDITQTRGAADAATVIPFHRARQQTFDATWYPWNGMRFGLPGGTVATIHDVFAFAYPHRNPIARRREQRPILRAVKQATALTSVSEFSARELERQFGVPLERLTIAPPVPSDFWKPVPAAAGRPYFLFIAAPDARKNAAMLFGAFADAFAHREVELIIAGSLSAADQGLLKDRRIAHVLRTPTDAELRTLYSGALALLMPSLDEGYGLPAVEAMACGSAVVASDRGGLPEACDGAALLLPALDVRQWQDAMRLLATDAEKREQLRQRSLTRARRIDRSRPGRIIAERLRRAAAAAR
ncbi:MAG: glycosyltransferase family 4 protein [Candidatus Eremiobacteraeota bacterium]|nr:glycosyltransferase family 4 protein [Candidatus Eremiobacteraeota bacterium]